MLHLAPCGASYAATFLFFHSEPGDYIGAGIDRLFTPAVGVFSATRNSASGVTISFDDGSWNLDFSAPNGETLVAGAYEGATRFPFQAPAEPGLNVSGEARGCNTLTGRFVIVDAVYGGGGEVESFAADFEQHCEGGAPALFGAIRFKAGDLACPSGSDGNPCDDHDACSLTDVCDGGVCAGAPLPCNDHEACNGSEVCDPRSGLCLGGVPSVCEDADPCTDDGCRNGACVFVPVVCDDGNMCNGAETCEPVSGCVPGTSLRCDDGDPCSDDICEPASGCRNPRLTGTCWTLAGTLKVTACLQGRCAQQRGRLEGTLVVEDDGGYRIPSSGSACPSSGAPAPDEFGTWRPGRRGRLVLEPANLGEIVAAMKACLEGFSLKLKSYRHRERIAPDALSLRGVSVMVGHVRVRGRLVGVRVVARYTGTRRPDGLGPGGSARRPVLPALDSEARPVA